MTHLRAHNPGDRLAWLALALILVPMLLLAMVSRVAMPHWDSDPFVSFVPDMAITPSAALVLNLLIVLGAAVAVWSSRRVWVWGVVLALIGSVGVLIHGAGELEDLLVGSPWIAGVFAAVGLYHLAARAQMRAIAGGVLIGFVVMLASRGAVQYFVEHAHTVAMFDEQRESILASRGWTEGSSAARVYERRLRQPEATGWFGLANVYATWAVVGLVGCAGVVLGSFKKPLADVWGSKVFVLIVSLVGVFASLGALLMAGSKGGYAAAGLGLVMLLVLWLLAGARGLFDPLRHAAHDTSPAGGGGGDEFAVLSCTRGARWGVWSSRLLGPGVIVLVLGLVVVRGFVGERVGELSVLFRWFYMQGAARVWGEHPVVGVGPAGFQDAYRLAKPALSPEEVTSPHSVLLDWVATLGWFGLVWGVLLVWLAVKIGAVRHSVQGCSTVSARRAGPPSTSTSNPLVWLLVLCGLALACSAWVEMAMITPEGAAARAVGLVGWVGVAEVVRRALLGGDRWASIGLAAAALAAIGHAQIEMSATFHGSAALVLGLVGLAAGREEGNGGKRAPGNGQWAMGDRKEKIPSASLRSAPPLSGTGEGIRVRGALCVAMCLLVGAIGWIGLPRLVRWEGALARAAGPAVVVRLERDGIMAAGDEPAELGRRVRALADRLGLSMPANEPELEGLIAEGEWRARVEALDDLRGAVAARPGHIDTRIALTRVLLTVAHREAESSAMVDEAVRVTREGTETNPASASSWAWYGAVQSGVAGSFASDGAARVGERLAGAAQAYERAHALDPHGLRAPMRLMSLHERLGDREAARAWAQRALANDAQLRLDPVRQMTDAERREAERLAGG